MFQLEPRIPVRLLLDTSKSMTTGGNGSPTKFDYARKLAGALCYVGLVRLDSICLQPFSDKLADAFIASGGRHRFQPAVEFSARASSPAAKPISSKSPASSSPPIRSAGW